MAFCHLHTHTEYSLLDGAASIPKLIKRVKELGMTSCAITDHGSMYGVADFDREARANGIHPVIGCEVYVAPGSRHDKVHGIDNKYSHLILLAENNIGYKNLIKIVSLGYIEGFYYKPRIDKELLRKYHEGIIVLSACIAGEVPKAILNGGYEKAKKVAREYIDIVGKDNYFLEIQDHGIAEQKRIIPDMIKLSEELGVGLVATNDIHYLLREDAKYQDVLMCIQTERTVDNPDRMSFETDEFYVKSEDEMREIFSYVPEAIENTQKIADRCNVEFDFGSRHLPAFDVPDGKDAFEYLKELCYDGIKKRYSPVNDELYKRLDYELGVIKNMGFVDYFLIVRDFIHYAKTHGVMVGPGRGSAAGSIVSYCLEITSIDPIRHSLIFERFLNPERVSMPDIDIDFEPNGRQKIIDYVVEKYGAEQVAQIVTFGTMKAKLAIRDVGRALNIPYAEVDKVAKLVPRDLNITIERALVLSHELKALYDTDDRVKELIDTSKALEGLPRHASTHAAGVVITSEPIVNYLPLQLNADNFITTQFTKDTVEALGLLKMDFLGLRNLTVIENAIKLVEKTHGIKIDLEHLDYDKKEVYELISSGNTDGVFQLESPGMQSFMEELKPDSLEDIIAGIALYRPGPMEQIPRYVHNKTHPEDITYKHPLLKDILDVTYGCMVYQEQVLEIVRVLAGYSLGKADSMRRVISKKKADKMKIERQNFIYGNPEDGIPGCINNGIDEKTAIAIFDEINDFANYAFNKSHAAAYAYVTYQTAYLKTFYPVEYMAALISSIEESEKINHYIANCAEMGIDRLPPDINKSDEDFSVEDGKIRFGLSAIKNVGRQAVCELVEERNKNGEFKSFSDFIERISPLSVKKPMVEQLINCGAFDSFGAKRSQLLFVFEKAMDSTAQSARENVKGQLSLFGESERAKEMELPNIDELDKKTLLSLEKESMGMYFSGHPMEEYRKRAAKITNVTIGTVLASVTRAEDGGYITVAGGLQDNQNVTICAAIAARKNKTTRNDSQMAFLTLEDTEGSMECIVFPKVLEKYSYMLNEDSILTVSGRLSFREDEAPKLLAQNFENINAAYARACAGNASGRYGAGGYNGYNGYNKNNRYSENAGNGGAPQGSGKILYIRLPKQDNDTMKKAIENLAPYQGNTEVRLFFADTKKTVRAPRRYWFNATPQAIDDLKSIFGEDCVKVKG